MKCRVCGNNAGGFRQICPTPCRSKWREMRAIRLLNDVRRWQHKQLSQGRCAGCGGPKTGNTWKCQACREKSNNSHQRRRARYRREGRCIECGAGLFVARFARCLDCRLKVAARERKRRAA